MAPLRFIFSSVIFFAFVVFAFLSEAETALSQGWNDLVHFFRLRRG